MKREEIVEKLKDYSEDDLHQIREVADRLFNEKKDARKATELFDFKAQYEGKWFEETVYYHGMSYADTFPYENIKKYFYVKEVTFVGSGFLRCKVSPFIKVALEQEDNNYLLAKVNDENFLKIDFMGEYEDYDVRIDSNRIKECSKADVEKALAAFEKKFETIKKSI